MAHGYFLDLGAPLTVKVVQRDGARVLVPGTVDAVPEANLRRRRAVYPGHCRRDPAASAV